MEAGPCGPAWIVCSLPLLAHNQIEREEDDAQKEHAQRRENAIHAPLVGVLIGLYGEGEHDDEADESRKMNHKAPYF